MVGTLVTKAREFKAAKTKRYKALDAVHVASDAFIAQVKGKLGNYNFDRLDPKVRTALSNFMREDSRLCAHVGLLDTNYDPKALVTAAKTLARVLGSV